MMFAKNKILIKKLLLVELKKDQKDSQDVEEKHKTN